MHRKVKSPIKYLSVPGLVAAALTLTGCTIKDQEAPALSGPSGFGVSLTIAASPAVLPRDGSSQSIITVTARDGSGKGVPNLRVLATASPESTPLSLINSATDSEGRARIQLTAPAMATVAANNEIAVWITPVGEDFLNARAQVITVALLGPSNATYPSPAFTISPEAPKAGTSTVFDASTTTDEGIPCDTCTYVWTIAGDTQTGRVAAYTFPSEGAYPVTLTVTDATGSTRSTTRAVEVAAVAQEGTP